MILMKYRHMANLPGQKTDSFFADWVKNLCQTFRPRKIHDVLRISTILESWGDLELAKIWIASQKERLNGIIQDDLEFKLLELDEEYNEDIAEKQARYDAALKVIEDKEAENAKPTAAQLKNLTVAKTALDKLIAEKEAKVIAAQEQAEKESKSIDAVEVELVTMERSLLSIG